MKDKEKTIEEVEITEKAVRKNEDNTGAMVNLLNQEQAELQKAMIKKIKLIIDERCEAELGQVHASSRGGKVIKTVDTILIAKDIYNAGYRKLPKDSVVLSREEICELKCQAEEDFNKAYYLGSKETAEKILKNIITKLIDNVAIEGDWELEDFEYSGEEIKEVLNELAKQFGVEIKE